MKNPLEIVDAISARVSTADKAYRLRVVPPNVRPHPDNMLGDVWGRKAPKASTDLERILALPSRTVTEADKVAMAAIMTDRLARKRSDDCRCHAVYNRPCIRQLKPAQGWALYEMGTAGGLLGPIGVGQGKTALDFLAPMAIRDCRVAVLLVPPGLVSQLEREYLLWSEHWIVPSLVLRGGAHIQPGRPALHVVPYSRLSRAEATTLLQTLNPDLIIADESHRVRNVDSVRTSRFVRYFASNAKTRLCAWSGSMTDKSIRDYAHLSGLALAERSPLPLDVDTVHEWSNAIDPPPLGKDPAPMGALSKLCEVGERLQDAFRRRLLSTEGVVATEDPGINASLYMHERNPGRLPDSVSEALANLRETWLRPDGEVFVEAYAVSKCARELASGFFYKWIFPRGESQSLIDRWFEARKNWRAEVRQKLQRREPHLDQPMLLANAAIRYYQGYVGPLPVWKSQCWPAWRDVRGLVKPETEAVWLDDYLVHNAADWGHKHRGVIWYEHTAFARRLGELSDLPVHGGGPGARERIMSERGDRSIIASTRAHGEGLDGLQFLFCDQLVANPPTSKQTGGAARWEQLLGRLHREGQSADEINTWLYRHTPEMRDAWDRAHQLARYVNTTMGSFQKLLCSTETW